MSDLIGKKDMIELTGATQPSKQCQVLRQNGIRFTTKADGSPSLTWEAYNRQLANKPELPEYKGPRIAEL